MGRIAPEILNQTNSHPVEFPALERLELDLPFEAIMDEFEPPEYESFPVDISFTIVFPEDENSQQVHHDSLVDGISRINIST